MNAHAHFRPHARRGPALRTADTIDAGGVGSSSDGFAVTLAATPEAPAQARRAVTGALEHWRTDRRDAALLVISELVTNAVRHGSARAEDCVRLRLRRRGRATRIEVTDVGARGGVVVEADDPLRLDARSGWGLPIVAELTDRWGVERDGSSTRVWCELDPA